MRFWIFKFILLICIYEVIWGWNFGQNLFPKKTENLKISLFGASGGVGQQICDRLNVLSDEVDKKIEISAFGRNPNAMADFELLQRSNCKFYQADLRDLPSLVDTNRQISGIIKQSDSIIISVKYA